MAQLHVIGELVGGKDFPSANLFCKFGIVAGPDWRLLEGLDSGQTQVTLAGPTTTPPLPLAMLATTTHHACFGADTTLLHLIRCAHCATTHTVGVVAHAFCESVDVNLLNTNTHFQSHPQVDHPVLTEMAQWSHPIGTSAHTQTQTHTHTHY